MSAKILWIDGGRTTPIRSASADSSPRRRLWAAVTLSLGISLVSTPGDWTVALLNVLAVQRTVSPRKTFRTKGTHNPDITPQSSSFRVCTVGGTTRGDERAHAVPRRARVGPARRPTRSRKPRTARFVRDYPCPRYGVVPARQILSEPRRPFWISNRSPSTDQTVRRCEHLATLCASSDASLAVLRRGLERLQP